MKKIDNILERVLLNMKYDSRKTLSENKMLITEATDPKLTFYGPSTNSKDTKVLWTTAGTNNSGTVAANIGKIGTITNTVDYKNDFMVYSVNYNASAEYYKYCVLERYPDFTGTVEERKKSCTSVGGYWIKDENRCSKNMGRVKTWDENCKQGYITYEDNLQKNRFNACLKTIKSSPILMGMPFSIEQKYNKEYADDDAEHWFEAIKTPSNGVYTIMFWFNDNDSCTFKGFNYVFADTGITPLKGQPTSKPKEQQKPVVKKVEKKVEKLKALTKNECIGGGKQWNEEDQVCYDQPEVEIVGTKKDKPTQNNNKSDNTTNSKSPIGAIGTKTSNTYGTQGGYSFDLD
jgi:hypothetical protein